jgi:UDP-N-acetylglucosamine transferase subunit ALG13
MDKVIEEFGEVFHLAVEYDINPLVLFDREGKIVYYNREAEILLSYLGVGELFQFALQKSPLPPQQINLHFEPL